MSGKTNQGDRVAVVTGGAGAIGGAIVARLAPDHTVVVFDAPGICAHETSTTGRSADD